MTDAQYRLYLLAAATVLAGLLFAWALGVMLERARGETLMQEIAQRLEREREFRRHLESRGGDDGPDA